MKIIVCVKQVPEVDNITINPETGTLIRDGVSSILNPFCEYALDHAIELKAFDDSIEIIAISMGPPQAEAALIRCLELGADRAILIGDRKFAGADTLATSSTLAAAIRKFVPDYNLILVGKQAIDGDTAQVGPGIAEILGLPQILYGIEINVISDRKGVRVKRENESGFEVLETQLPAVISVSMGQTTRRMPSLAAFLKVRKQVVKKITASDLDVSDSELGLNGSLTRVLNMFPPETKQCSRKIEGSEPGLAAREIAVFLRTEGYM